MTHLTETLLLVLVAVAMLGMPSLAQGESQGSWTRLPDMAVPRWEAGSVVFEEKLCVFGGYRMPTKACKRVDVFDPKDNSWATLGRQLHYIGGLTEDRDTCSPKHWVLNVDKLEKGEAQWQEAKPMSKGRCHFGTVTFEGKIYLAGGSPNGATPQPGMWVCSVP